MEFVTTNETSVEFKAIVLLDVAADPSGVLTAKFFMNEVLIGDFIPMQTVFPGKFILNLYYPMENVEENKVNTFRVLLGIDAGSATIGRGQARATISGQGFASQKAEWNGNLDFEEKIAPFKYDYCFTGFTDEIDVAERIPHQPIFTESIRPLKYEYFFSGFTGETVANEVVTSNTITQFTSSSKYIIIDEESARLRTAYERESIAGIIDNGYLERLELSSEWRRIDSVDIKTNIDREVN